MANTLGGTARSVPGKVLALLVTVGVVIGCWQFLGDGRMPGDPGFVAAAQNHIREFGDWSLRMLHQYTGR